MWVLLSVEIRVATVKPNIDCVQTSGLEVGQLPGEGEPVGGDGQGLHAGDGLQSRYNIHHISPHKRLSPCQPDLRFCKENVKYGRDKIIKVDLFDPLGHKNLGNFDDLI